MPVAFRCSCGHEVPEGPDPRAAVATFAKHFSDQPKAMRSSHKSLGKFDLETGKKVKGNAREEKEKFFASVRGEAPQQPREKIENPELPASAPNPSQKKPSLPGSAGGLTPGAPASVVPRSFVINTTILWQAQQAATRQWGFDPNMAPGDFLDTCLYLFFKNERPKGPPITLGGYSVGEEDESDGNGNGHKTYSEDELKEVAAMAVQEALARVAGRKN